MAAWSCLQNPSYRNTAGHLWTLMRLSTSADDTSGLRLVQEERIRVHWKVGVKSREEQGCTCRSKEKVPGPTEQFCHNVVNAVTPAIA
jgi:hypothetical protein